MVRVTTGEENGDKTVILEMDGMEGKGTIILKEGAFGWEIFCPAVSEYSLGSLDLYYASPIAMNEEGEPGPPIQLIINSPAETEDPLGRVRWFPKGTVVDFDREVIDLDNGVAVAPDRRFGFGGEPIGE